MAGCGCDRAASAGCRQNATEVRPGKQASGGTAGDPAAARLTGGLSVAQSLQGRPTTAHFLAGAVMEPTLSTGVVDRNQCDRPLLICDGSLVSANVGVNPSLTIVAMAEHALAAVPARASAAQAG